MGNTSAQWEEVAFSAGGLHGCEEKLAAYPCFKEQRGSIDDGQQLPHNDAGVTEKFGTEWKIRRCSSSLVASLHLPMLESVDLGAADLVLSERTISFSFNGKVASAVLPTSADLVRCNTAKFSRRTRMLRVKTYVLDTE